ncbi:helix-turn-helix transcriptional regulator [Haloprofundus salinisoli]|uniref:helix-turn-helix transcriptional regulator n=1 Tax=Haloprofundus salinisoli TaxID=2876193 RepID=UPI001CCE38B5|nr:ArsR family transcriptional regulator [Haloprofundus salinisoli]
MTDPLEEIEFLARSQNRIAVLDAVASGPHTRRELEDAVGASQPTLARILRDFEERHWVEREGMRYDATASGAFVAASFTDLLSNVETEVHLRPVVQWLPTAHLDVDLARFDDARITRPTQTTPNGPLKRALELSAQAEAQLVVSYVLNYEMLETLHGAAVEGTQSLRGVLSRETVETLRDDPTSWRRFRELLSCENVALRLAEEPIPFAVGVADETVYFFLRDGDGLLRALLESTDSEIREWAVRAVNDYWNRGVGVDGGDES